MLDVKKTVGKILSWIVSAQSTLSNHSSLIDDHNNAINSHSSSINTLNTATTRAEFWTTRDASETKNIPARSGVSFNPTSPAVSGYTPVAVIARGQNHGNSVYITSETRYTTYCYNTTSSALNTTVTHTYLYLRTMAQGR